MPRLRCAKSEKSCEECEQNPECKVYSERYVLREQLRKLKKLLEDTLTIVKAILGEV